MKLSVLIPAVIAVLSCFAGADPILNGGFDEDLAHWEVSGYLATTTGLFLDPNGNPDGLSLTPVEGNSFVFLRTGGQSSEPIYTQLNQVITLRQGELVRGKFFFLTDDYSPYDDFASIKLLPHNTNQMEIELAYVTVRDVGDFNSTIKWRPFSHIIEPNQVGTYTLELKVQNAIDYLLPSYLLVDALAVLSDPNCNFMLAGDTDGDCKVDFFDLAVSQNLADADEIKYIDALARSWLVDCFYDPNQAQCVPWITTLPPAPASGP
ncbi:MAG: hypothetical protein A2Y07_01525 [Planctomycetes bacterium GWF2_50_10]|nr:MAG: hypothetical protein A2Y07_01525 [Planctomycetes bacterium GWF2_50_10]